MNQGGGTIVKRVSGEGVTDQALKEFVADEFFESIEKKDIKGMREALHALVLILKETKDIDGVE